jgi:hypothetical protein
MPLWSSVLLSVTLPIDRDKLCKFFILLLHKETQRTTEIHREIPNQDLKYPYKNQLPFYFHFPN